MARCAAVYGGQVYAPLGLLVFRIRTLVSLSSDGRLYGNEDTEYFRSHSERD